MEVAQQPAVPDAVRGVPQWPTSLQRCVRSRPRALPPRGHGQMTASDLLTCASVPASGHHGLAMELTVAQAAILRELVQQWHALESGGSRLVVVHGPLGMGKTRIVHALYEVIWTAAEQADPSYPLFWPAVLGDPSVPRARRRKQVAPTGPENPLARLSFAWLGRSCYPGDSPKSSGEFGSLIAEQVLQALYMDYGQGEKDLRNALLALLLALVDAAGGLLLGPPGSLAGAVLSWADVGADTRRLALQMANGEGSALNDAEWIGRLPWVKPATTRVTQMTDGLVRLARLGVPVVIAIEDGHLADEGTVSLCRSVMASQDARVLIVATAESEALLGQVSACERLGALLAIEVEARYRPKVMSLAEPTSSELEAMAVKLLPTADDHQLQTLVSASCGRPEQLVVAVEASAAGLIPPTGRDVSSALFQQHWSALPSSIRTYLAAAAMFHGAVWVDQPLDGMLALTRDVQDDGRRHGLERGLILPIDQWRLAFADPSVYKLALASAVYLFPPDQVEICRRDLFESISADKKHSPYWTTLPLPVRATLLRTQVGLYPDPSLDAFDALGPELIDSYDQLAGIDAQADDVLNAIRSAARAVDMIELVRRHGGVVEAHRELGIRARHAYLPALGQELAGVLEEAEQFADSVASRHGQRTPEWVFARWNIANILAAAHSYERASAIASQLLATASVGQLPFAVRGQLRRDEANWIGEAGRPDEAVEKLQALMGEAIATYGVAHHNTIVLRAELAGWHAHAGRGSYAVKAYKEIIVDALRTLGDNDPYLLTLRGNLAYALESAGQTHEAILTYRLLLSDLLRVLGPDNPETLAVRNNLATALGEALLINESIAELERLIEDNLRILGQDDDRTLNARNNLATMLSKNERSSDAIAAYEQVLADCARVLGTDNPRTLTTRSNLAGQVASAGRIDEAIPAFESLVTDCVRVLGRDHPTTLNTRRNLVYWMGESGRTLEAIAASETLLEDCLRALGADNPETFSVRNNLAYRIGESGDISMAVALFEELLTDRSRVLGPDHPDTARTRNNLILWRQRGST